MTLAAAQCRVWIQETWPGTPVSRFACRDTASGRISQHSAYGSPRPDFTNLDDSNALDVYGPGKTSGPADQAHIQAIVDTINADGRWKWSIRQIVWKTDSLHMNHAHLDFYPKVATRKWCGGPETPKWVRANGDVLWTRDPWPDNGRYDGSGSSPVEPPDDEVDMQEYIRAQQENLNAAGFTDSDGNPLVVDGIYGPKTKSAEAARDAAAASGGSGGFIPHTHEMATGTPTL